MIQPVWLAFIASCAANTVVTQQLDTALDEAVTQVQRIAMLQDSDFIFDFLHPNMVGSTTPGEASGPDGHIVTASTLNMPALISEDVSLSLGSIGPCGMNTPHTHPRATEFNYVVNGSFTTGMFQENGARFVLGNASAGQASLFPRGSIHFEANLGCEPVTFVAAFSNPDGGVLSVAQGFFGLPPTVIDAVLGNHLDDNQINILQTMIPHNVAYGLAECLKRCGLKPVIGRTISNATYKKHLYHNKTTGVAYGIFIGVLIIFFTIVQQFRKTIYADYFRMGPAARRYLTYAPTVTLSRGLKSGKPIQFELPANLRSVMIVLFWLANVALAVWDIEDENPHRLFFQRVGWLAIYNMIGFLILAMKSSPLPWLLGRSHEGLTLYHKVMAITAFFEVWIHSIWGMYVIPYANPEHHFYWTQAQTGAWIATPFFTIVVITAWSSWFVRAHFETFLVVHVCGLVGCLVGLWLHNRLLLWYVVAMIGIWAFDRIFRMLRVFYLNRYYRTEKAALSSVEGATKISFHTTYHWRAGSHIYINFPGCDPMQSHPYTIASISRKTEWNEIQLLVQGSGGRGFSEKLRKQLDASGGFMERSFIFHGPYGAAPNMKHYDRVLCIGGGSGITLPIAMVQAFLMADQENGGRASLVWSTRAFSDFTRFDLPAIKAAGANIYLYETKPQKSETGFAPLARRATSYLTGGMRKKTMSEKQSRVEEIADQQVYASDAITPHPRTDEGHSQSTNTAGRAVMFSSPSSASEKKIDSAGLSSAKRPGPHVTSGEVKSSSGGSGGDDASDEMGDSVGDMPVMPAKHYQGTQHHSTDQDTSVVSPAVSMPSFIASVGNRMLHRQATIKEISHLTRKQTITDTHATRVAESLGMSMDRAAAGDAAAGYTAASVTQLRELFAPIGRGRPDYTAILKTFLDSAESDESLAIIVCGNPGICRSVRNALALSRAKQKIDLHVEEF